MIYTKTGDMGTTSLIGGTRVDKCHSRVEAYGTVDELGAQIALLTEQMAQHPVFATPCTLLRQVQRQLFTIQTLLALEPDPIHPVGIDIEAYSTQLTAHCTDVEHAIDHLQATLPPFRGFVIPGGNTLSAQSHVARTVCRRAERRIVALYNEQPQSANAAVLSYVNRLSDYLFVLSRHILAALGNDECFL